MTEAMMLTPDDYLDLAKANEAATVYGVALPELLTRHGCGDLTRCPECRRDWFGHRAGCTVAVRVETEMRRAEV